jgi:hypothetical protein
MSKDANELVLAMCLISAYEDLLCCETQDLTYQCS